MSAMLRAREANMLGRDRMDRMLAAGSYAEAAKLLAECGYEDLSGADAAGIDAALTKHRNEIFAELAGMAPQPEVVDIFRLKYDYHNLKALLKAQAMGVDGGRLLVNAGRVPAAALETAVREGDDEALPPALREAAREARQVLSTTGDPQLSDFVLDRAYYAEMLSCAGDSGSDVLVRYVQAIRDAANLRSAVRTLRMKKGGDFLRQVLFPGGPSRRTGAHRRPGGAGGALPRHRLQGGGGGRRRGGPGRGSDPL